MQQLGHRVFLCMLQFGVQRCRRWLEIFSNSLLNDTRLEIESSGIISLLNDSIQHEIFGNTSFGELFPINFHENPGISEINPRDNGKCPGKRIGFPKSRQKGGIDERYRPFHQIPGTCFPVTSDTGRHGTVWAWNYKPDSLFLGKQGDCHQFRVYPQFIVPEYPGNGLSAAGWSRITVFPFGKLISSTATCCTTSPQKNHELEVFSDSKR